MSTLHTNMLNEKTVTLKLKRIKVCDLSLALTMISQVMEQNKRPTEKWKKLHDEINAQLHEFDKSQGF